MKNLFYSKFVFRGVERRNLQRTTMKEKLTKSEVAEFYKKNKITRKIREKFYRECQKKQRLALKIPKEDLRVVLNLTSKLRERYEKLQNSPKLLLAKFDSVVYSVLQSPKVLKMEEARRSGKYRAEEKARRHYRGFKGGLRLEKDVVKAFFTGEPTAAKFYPLLNSSFTEFHVLLALLEFREKHIKMLEKLNLALSVAVQEKLEVLHKKRKRFQDQYENLPIVIVGLYSPIVRDYLLEEIKKDPEYSAKLEECAGLEHAGKTSNEKFKKFITKEKVRLGSNTKRLAAKLREYEIKYKSLFLRYETHMKHDLSALKREKHPKLTKLIQVYSPDVKDVWSYLSNPKALSIPLLKEAIRILKKEMLIREVPNRGVVYLVRK